MAGAYDYIVLTLDGGLTGWRSFAAHANGAAAQALAERGGSLVGLFAPQLGFASNAAALLVRWSGPAPEDLDVLTGAPQVSGWLREALTATARPVDGRPLRSGGVYVHRWFVIDPGRDAEFVDLSRRAWPAFEAAYETEIFGLFRAARTAADRAADQERLLLITWYASHGVWEASREQTNDPDSLFVRRQQLIRSTIGRSTILAPAA